MTDDHDDDRSEDDDVCRHGVSFSEVCEDCEDEALNEEEDDEDDDN